VGAIVSSLKIAVVWVFVFSVAAYFTYFSAQPTAKMTAVSSEGGGKPLGTGEPSAAEPPSAESVAQNPSTYELEECSKQLELHKKYVSELVDIVLNKCDSPRHDFEIAALEIAKKNTYSEDGFNCVYYSDILAGRLKSMGYDARIVNGYYKGEPHSWVVMEVPIEATSGNLITPQHYSDYVINENG